MAQVRDSDVQYPRVCMRVCVLAPSCSLGGCVFALAITAEADQVVNMQLGMYNARHAAKSQTRWVRAVSDDWWLASFLEYANATSALQPGLATRSAPWDAATNLPVWSPPMGQNLGDALHNFLQVQPRFLSSLAVHDTADGKKLVASTCHLLLIGQPVDRDVVDLLFDVRPAVREAAAQYGMDDASIYEQFFLFTQMGSWRFACIYLSAASHDCHYCVFRVCAALQTPSWQRRLCRTWPWPSLVSESHALSSWGR